MVLPIQYLYNLRKHLHFGDHDEVLQISKKR